MAPELHSPEESKERLKPYSPTLYIPVSKRIRCSHPALDKTTAQTSSRERLKLRFKQKPNGKNIRLVAVKLQQSSMNTITWELVTNARRDTGTDRVLVKPHAVWG